MPAVTATHNASHARFVLIPQVVSPSYYAHAPNRPSNPFATHLVVAPLGTSTRLDDLVDGPAKHREFEVDEDRAGKGAKPSARV